MKVMFLGNLIFRIMKSTVENHLTNMEVFLFELGLRTEVSNVLAYVVFRKGRTYDCKNLSQKFEILPRSYFTKK